MFAGPIIDCDVHNWCAEEELYPYLSEGWREYVLGPGKAGPISTVGTLSYANPHGFWREDSMPETETFEGPDPEMTAAQLLDRFNIDRAVLTYETQLYVANIPNPFFAAELARASNDWLIDRWLAKDERFYGSILIANQVPELAVKEIYRLADNPRFVQILMANNGLGMPYGHPLFHPIYEAAAECGLAIGLHAGQSGGVNPIQCASGHPNFYIEHHTLIVQGVMTTLVSFITQGVFEKFPNLKLILLEGGVSWVPALVWRFDAAYKHLKQEVPWVKRLPSEYVREHVRVSTQPLELSPKKEQALALLDSIGGEDILMFASDYPHWDADEADHVAERLPASWLPQVMRENALKALRWPDQQYGGNGGRKVAEVAVGAL